MKKKLVAIATTLIVASATLVGCTEANQVSHNVSQEADNFNVLRRLTVINSRTDKVWSYVKI
jgi:outer membrane lipoprotein SlyB